MSSRFLFLSLSLHTTHTTQSSKHTVQTHSVYTPPYPRVPSCPAGLWRAHSCQRDWPYTSCSPPPLACGGPDWQADDVFAGPRQGWPSWEGPHTEAPGGLEDQDTCCCHCSARCHAGTLWSGCKGRLCGALAVPHIGFLLPHWVQKNE